MQDVGQPPQHTPRHFQNCHLFLIEKGKHNKHFHLKDKPQISLSPLSPDMCRLCLFPGSDLSLIPGQLSLDEYSVIQNLSLLVLSSPLYMAQPVLLQCPALYEIPGERALALPGPSPMTPTLFCSISSRSPFWPSPNLVIT